MVSTSVSEVAGGGGTLSSLQASVRATVDVTAAEFSPPTQGRAFSQSAMIFQRRSIWVWVHGPSNGIPLEPIFLPSSDSRASRSGNPTFRASWTS